MRAVVVIVGMLTVLVLAVDVHAATVPSCLIFCHQRHPVREWELRHHVARCETWHCREKRRRGTHVAVHRPAGVYPCVIHWTYDGVRWWRYHYAAGGSRNHVGLGPKGVRTCLPGQ